MTGGAPGRPSGTAPRGVLGSAIFWVGLLFTASLFLLPMLRPLFEWAFPGVEPAVYNRTTFLALFLSHAGGLVSSLVWAGRDRVCAGIP